MSFLTIWKVTSKMADEELIITLRNEEFVRKLNDTQKVIQATKKEMDELYNANRKGFSDIDKLNAYEKKMSDLKVKFAEVTTEEKKLIDSHSQTITKTNELGEAAGSLSKKLGLAALAIAAITKLVKGVIDAFKDTVLGLNAITIGQEVWKQMTYNIATANFTLTEFTRSLTQAVVIGKLANEQRKIERKDLVLSSQLREEYNQLYFESADRTKNLQSQLEKLNKAEEIHNRMINVELENANRELYIVELQLINRPKSNKLLDEEAKLLAKINTIEGQRFSEVKRVEMRRSTLVNQIRENDMKKYIDWIEENLKRQDEFQKLSLNLADKANKAQIDMLEGNDKLKAQRDYDLKQLDEFKKQMEKLGKLNAEQENQFAIWGANIWLAFYNGWQKESEKPLPQKDIDAISKALIGSPDIIRKNIVKEQENIQKTLIANKAMEPFSIWKLIGIDTESEEGKEQIYQLQKFTSDTIGILEDGFAQKAEIAQRERELIESRIDETQREMELEAELMEEGYANNVDLKRKELEDLKKQRDKAYAEEEAARKRQMALDTVMQTVDLISASAEIWKTFASVPPVALAMIAVMWASFLSAKTKAKELTKLAEGGSGTELGLVTGKRHSEGGERFLDHLEVERGEAFGVLSRGATERYGKVFHEMVSSFNKNEMPEFITPAISNSVKIENSGPNSRLDNVIKEQRKLNESILNQTQITSIGNKKIIKSGNKIRIIG